MPGDKRELYRTAVIAKSGSVFKFGEVVSVRAKYKAGSQYVFECKLDNRVANYAESLLTNFCL